MCQKSVHLVNFFAVMKAIIIGATSGIGLELATQLAEQGWELGVGGRRVEELVKLSARYGAKVQYEQIDITADNATRQLDALLKKVPLPDLFLHVAGIGYHNRSLEAEKELATVRTNCEGMVRMVTHFVAYVRNHEEYNDGHKAHLAVVSSIAGTKGLGAAPAYSATKRMESTYLQALAQLSRMDKIPLRITDIRPGFVATVLLDKNRRYPMLLSRQDAARHILRGIRRHKRVVTVDWKYRILVALWRLLPRPLWERLTWVDT